MKIDFWNDLFSVAFPCCDCNPGTFGIPSQMVNEYKYGYGSTIGFTNPADSEEDQANKIYLVRKTTYKDDSTIKPPKNPAGHITTETYSNPYDINISTTDGTVEVSNTKQEVTQSGGDSFKGPATITYESPLTRADAKATMIDKITGAIDFDDGKSFQRVSTNFVGTLIGGRIQGSGFTVNVEHGRYRGERTEPSFNESPNYFLQKWVTFFIPFSYDEYIRNFNDYEQSVKNHDNWMKCQEATPGQCGTEPEILDKPEIPQESPIHMIDGEYEYDRGPAVTEWVEIPLIDTEVSGGGSVRNENVTIVPYRHRSGILPRLVSGVYIDPNNPFPQ